MMDQVLISILYIYVMSVFVSFILIHLPLPNYAIDHDRIFFLALNHLLTLCILRLARLGNLARSPAKQSWRTLVDSYSS